MTYSRRHADLIGPSDDGHNMVGIDEPHRPGAAAPRLAAALGWERLPELTPEERREADERMAAAQADARRIYGIDDVSTA